MKVYRVVLAVDHYDLLADARSVIDRHRNLVLAGEAAIGIELLSLLNMEPADVAVFSMVTPSHRKREVIRIISRRFPRLKIFFIYHRILMPSARGASKSTRPDIFSSGTPAGLVTFNTTGMPFNVFQRQWRSHLIEH